jgi:hypothetical protein
LPQKANPSTVFDRVQISREILFCGTYGSFTPLNACPTRPTCPVKCELLGTASLFNRDAIFLSHSIGACPVQFFAKEERIGFNKEAGA